MRLSLLFAVVASLLLTPLAAQAGRLDIAIIQYTDARDTNAMAAALAEADLMKITDSDRMETNVPALTGGWVVFTQSIGASDGSSFASSTRLTNQRADVSGSLKGSNVSVRINILEGVKVGLRKFRENVYEGSDSVAGGVPRIIAVRQSTGKTQTAIKGRSTVVSYNFTTLIVAKFTP